MVLDRPGEPLREAELPAPENAWANGLAQGLGYTISFAISTPYLVTVLTILYFDQRVRKEGFDLQLMAEGLGVARDPNAPIPEPLRAPVYTPEQRAAAPYWPPPPGWQPPPFPPHVELAGRYCRLVPLDAEKHARQLFEAQREDAAGERWTYLFHGPYAEFGPYEKWCLEAQASRDPQFYAIVDAAYGCAAGSASYMRIEPRHGVIEVGNIYLSPRLSKTRAATEAIYLFIANAFALGYRRFEWKCDSCNLPSRAAATRFGFSYEGLFRQAIVNKGRNGLELIGALVFNNIVGEGQRIPFGSALATIMLLISLVLIAFYVPAVMREDKQ